MITLSLAAVTALQLTRSHADVCACFALFLFAKAIHFHTKFFKMQQDIDEEGKVDLLAHDVSQLKESALANRSAAYVRVGNFSAARDDAEMIITLFPNSVCGHKRRAEAAVAELDANRKARDSGASAAADQQIVPSSASPLEEKNEQKDEVRHIATAMVSMWRCCHCADLIFCLINGVSAAWFV